MKMGTQQQHNNQDRYVNELVPPRTDSTGFSLVYYLKNLDINYSFLYLLSLIMHLLSIKGSSDPFIFLITMLIF